MDSPLAVGDLVDGKYSVERTLAQGGNGVILRAHHQALLTSCAIKVLRREASDLPLAVERFLFEARALALLKSDYVVRVFDVGQLADCRFRKLCGVRSRNFAAAG